MLPDLTTSLYFFDYRSNFFSSSLIQSAVIIFCLLGALFHNVGSK